MTNIYFTNTKMKKKPTKQISSKMCPMIGKLIFFVCHFEDVIFILCPVDFKPQFTDIYLEDTFHLFDSGNQTKQNISVHKLYSQ